MFSTKLIETCETAADWTVLNADVANKAVSTTSFYGTNSMEFDKANSDADATEGGIYKTVDIDLLLEGVMPWDCVVWMCYVSDLNNVAYAFLRLGESATNNLEWRYTDSLMIAGWNCCMVRVGDAYLNGTGWDPEDIDYMALGVEFDGETNALADIKVDQVMVVPGSIVTNVLNDTA
jgi:hypothetical protein